MRRLHTMIHFASYRDCYLKKEVLVDNYPFYQLLKPALAEVNDESLEIIVINVDLALTSLINTKFKAKGSEILIIQEYVQRVLKFEESEHERLRIFEENIPKWREAFLKGVQAQAQAGNITIEMILKANELLKKKGKP